jgi:hypothetical protein
LSAGLYGTFQEHGGEAYSSKSAGWVLWDRLMQEIPDVVTRVENFVRRTMKDKFRFVVATREGHHSTAWFTRDVKKKNSFYIGARTIGGKMKISLHGELNCRLAFTKEGMAAMKQQGLDVSENRALVEWYRKPAPENGCVHVVSLIFPTDYLRLPAPESTFKEPLLFVDAAPPGKAVEFGVFFSRGPQIRAEPKFIQIGVPLVYASLDNGDTVWVVAWETEFDRAVIPSADQWRGSLRAADKKAFLDEGVELRNLSSVFWNAPKDGEILRVIETSGVTASVEEGIPVLRY